MYKAIAMKNIPKTIYLNIGAAKFELIGNENFDLAQGVTWSKERINETDVKYKLVKKTPNSNHRRS